MTDLWIYTLPYLLFTSVAPYTPYICVLRSENIDNPVQNRWDTLNFYRNSLFSPLPPNFNVGKCSGSEAEYRDTSFGSIFQHCTWGEGGNEFYAVFFNGFSNFGPISYLSHLFMHRIVHILQDRYVTLSLKNVVNHLLNIWHVIYQWLGNKKRYWNLSILHTLLWRHTVTSSKPGIFVQEQ